MVLKSSVRSPFTCFYISGSVLRQRIMMEGPCGRAVSLRGRGRSEKNTKNGGGQYKIQLPRETPVVCFYQQDPISCFPLSSNSIMILIIFQGMNPLIGQSFNISLSWETPSQTHLGVYSVNPYVFLSFFCKIILLFYVYGYFDCMYVCVTCI